MSKWIGQQLCFLTSGGSEGGAAGGGDDSKGLYLSVPLIQPPAPCSRVDYTDDLPAQ